YVSVLHTDSLIALTSCPTRRSSDLIDATIQAQAPKMAPHTPFMRDNIAADLNMPAERINIKAKTNEGLGHIGRKEGIAAQVVARSEEHTSELQSRFDLVCRLLLEKK